MGKKSSKAPDYEAAAEKEGIASKENTQMQTYANRPNQVNPWGSTSWTNEQVWDPATQQNVTQWEQTERLDPNIQSALDSQVDVQRGRSDLASGMLSRVGQEVGGAMDWSKYGDMTAPSDTPMYNPNEMATGYDQAGLKQEYGQEGLQRDIGVDPQEQLQSSSDAMFNQAKSRLDPQFQAEEQALEIKLRNQGLRRGDQAYEAALGAFNTRKTDAYNQANLSATQQGAQDASRMFSMYGQKGDFANQATNQTNQNTAQQAGFFNQATDTMNQAQADQAKFYNQSTGTMNQQNLAGSQYNQDAQFRQADYANQLRQAQIKEEMTQRGFSLNEVNALLSGQQVANPNFESFQGSTKSETPQYLSAATSQGNFDQQAAQGQQSGIASLGSAAMSAGMMMSDRRLKKNIKRIGTLLGYPLYLFDYIWGKTAIGFMSDEVNQDAVFVHPSGYDCINLTLVREI